MADAALLVVDGAPGGFEAGFGSQKSSPGGSDTQLMGQTREHVHIARSAGIKQLAVVVTKLDVCDFKQERFEEIKSQLGPFLKSCGYSKPDWLPVAAPDGQNVASAPSDARLQSWWGNSKTLVDTIDSFQPVAQHLSAFTTSVRVIDLWHANHRLPVPSSALMRSARLTAHLTHMTQPWGMQICRSVW
jgi:elongation factor 1 alpha-like protein